MRVGLVPAGEEGGVFVSLLGFSLGGGGGERWVREGERGLLFFCA